MEAAGVALGLLVLLAYLAVLWWAVVNRDEGDGHGDS